jgi:tripartite-type tricarboxylate transporter receptor subunit TctC
MYGSIVRRFGQAGAVLAVLSYGVSARADSLADFYSNKTITFVQASDAGGGYATTTELLIKYLPAAIPGHPKVQIQFMPGAGGVKGANYVYNVAPRDGTAIGMPLNTVALYQVLRPRAVKYNAAKFAWLGGLASLNSVVAVWHTAPATTLDGARKTQLIIGATAKTGSNYEQPMMANALAGTKFKLVTGYKGSNSLDLAMERGETNGRMSYWQSWQATRPDWIRDKMVIPLVQVGARPIKELPGVPRMIDFAKTDQEKSMVRLLQVTAALGRTVYGPPGMADERRAALRRAIETITADPAFLKEADRRHIAIDATSGAELEALVTQALHIPPAVVTLYKKSVGLD